MFLGHSQDLPDGFLAIERIIFSSVSGEPLSVPLFVLLTGLESFYLLCFVRGLYEGFDLRRQLETGPNSTDGWQCRKYPAPLLSLSSDPAVLLFTSYN